MDTLTSALSAVVTTLGVLTLASAVGVALLITWDVVASRVKRRHTQRGMDAHFDQAVDLGNSGSSASEQAKRDRAICAEMEKQWQS